MGFSASIRTVAGGIASGLPNTMLFLDDASSLLLAAALGTTLLLLASMAAVGGARTLRIVRQFGFTGVFLALFTGVVVESLAEPLMRTSPYTLVHLPPTVLRFQGLVEDPDLRTRYNVDPRLRYLGAKVPDLEVAFVMRNGIRIVDVPQVRHETPTALPASVVPMGEKAIGEEVDGLYERALATVEESGRGGKVEALIRRADWIGAAGFGLLVLGLVSVLAGAVPLLLGGLSFLGDEGRLIVMTASPEYRGARGRALRHGTGALRAWHRKRTAPHRALATFGLLATLGGLLLGFLREEETRGIAHRVFAQARSIRIDGKP